MHENFKSFMQRMEMLFPHTQCVQARVFYKLVKNEFRSIKRKSERDAAGDPVRYFEHVRRVAILLIDEVGVTDFVTIMTALGHDTIEDTRMELEEVTLICGSEVAQAIALCSKTPKVGFKQRLFTLGTYPVLTVKIADRIDNLRTLGTDLSFRAKTIQETEEMYLPLSRLLLRRTPVEFASASLKLVELLHTTLQEVKHELH